MKNKKSIALIVAISLFIGLLHFIIGPDYNGIYKNFMRGYLIDLLLPMNLYLLLQISLRKKISAGGSRIIAAIITFSLGLFVETMQMLKIEFLGSTYDPLDILMYGIGVLTGLLIDFTIIEKFENQK